MAPSGLCAPRVSAPAEGWGLVQGLPSRTCSGPLGPPPCLFSPLRCPLTSTTCVPTPLVPHGARPPRGLCPTTLQCRVRDCLPPGGPARLGSLAGGASTTRPPMVPHSVGLGGVGNSLVLQQMAASEAWLSVSRCEGARGWGLGATNDPIPGPLSSPRGLLAWPGDTRPRGPRLQTGGQADRGGGRGEGRWGMGLRSGAVSLPPVQDTASQGPLWAPRV